MPPISEGDTPSHAWSIGDEAGNGGKIGRGMWRNTLTRPD
jgi:hypothetical protein